MPPIQVKFDNFENPHVLMLVYEPIQELIKADDPYRFIKAMFCLYLRWLSTGRNVELEIFPITQLLEYRGIEYALKSRKLRVKIDREVGPLYQDVKKVEEALEKFRLNFEAYCTQMECDCIKLKRGYRTVAKVILVDVSLPELLRMALGEDFYGELLDFEDIEHIYFSECVHEEKAPDCDQIYSKLTQLASQLCQKYCT